MNMTVFTADQALQAVNQELSKVGEKGIARSTFYSYESLYVQYFPKTQWKIGKRLIHAEPVLIFVVLIARVQKHFNNLGVTNLFISRLLEGLTGKGVSFNTRFPNFSSVHSFMSEEFSLVRVA